MAGAALVCVITGGHETDITHAPALLNDLRRGSIVIGDRGYDSNALVNAITHTHGQALIPPRRTRIVQREYSRRWYRQRNRVERYFARLKQFRRIATRYDKTLASFTGFFDVANLHMQWTFNLA